MNQGIDGEALRATFPVLKSLDKEKWRILAEKINWIEFPEGDTLFEQGGPGLGLYLLYEGKVKISHRTPQGKKLIFKIVKQGDILGVATFFNKENYISFAKVIKRSKVGFIERNQFFRFLKDNPSVLFDFLNYLTHELMTFQLKLVETCYGGSKQRISRLFCRVEEDQLEITRADLANLIGVTYKTTIQTIKEMERRELIGIKTTILRSGRKAHWKRLVEGFLYQLKKTSFCKTELRG